MFFFYQTCLIGQVNPDDSLLGVFPGKEWSVITPEQVGFSSQKLKVAKSRFEQTGGVAALIVIKGYIIADWGLTNLPLDCRSIRKSLISSLFGIYMEKGLIDFDLNLKQIGINDKGKLNNKELTAKIKHLMSSTSGIYLPAAFEEETHRNKPFRTSKIPGEYFQYNNWDFNALSTIFAKMTGCDLFDAFDEEIAKPLQMEHFDGQRNTAYVYQPALSEHPAYLFRMSTKDLARYGLLYLNEGRWNGKQLIPKDWVIESTSAQIQTGSNYYYNYGYLWWVSKGENTNGRLPFLARGANSQYIYLDPNNDLIVIFRDNPDAIEKVSKAQAYPLIGAVYGAMSR